MQQIIQTSEQKFILAETSSRPVTGLPDITLHIADESLPLWQKTENYLGKTGMPPPFWAFAWPGGIALSRFILDNPEWVQGRYVLDFACGTGLVGIAAKKAGAARVLSCDIDPLAIAATEINAHANAVYLETLCGDIIGLDDGWDTVLVADICYERDTAARVMDWLQIIQKRGTDILIGDPGRTYLPKEKLIKIASYDIPVNLDLENSEIKNTGIWNLAEL